MNATIRMADDYRPEPSDRVLVLLEDGAMFIAELVRLGPDGEWTALPSEGQMFEFVVMPEEILGEVIA